MNLAALIDARVNPGRMQDVLDTRFERVEVMQTAVAPFQFALVAGDAERDRLIIRFLWAGDGWLYEVSSPNKKAARYGNTERPL
jgi:hypothetical protein